MGIERDDENPHRGQRPAPKLRMAGHLNCRIDGQSFSIVAENRDVIVCNPTLRLLLTLRRNAQRGGSPLLQILRVADIRLGIRVWGIRMGCVPARSMWWQLVLWREWRRGTQESVLISVIKCR